MPISYNKSTKEFHLFNDTCSYIIQILKNGHPGHLYYGKRLRERESYGHLLEIGIRSHAPCRYEGDCQFSLEHIKQEYPAFGSGDMRYPAYAIEQNNGSRTVDFTYQSHRIYDGKKKLEGLPATYVESPQEAVTLEITLSDDLLLTDLVLSYTIYETMPVITRSTKIICRNREKITLLSALSGCLDLPDKEYQMVDLTGAWARERAVRVRELDYGTQGVYSMRGCSSHQFNPFLALKRRTADETSGEVIGLSLVYSGDFLAQAEVDNFDVTRVLLGIHPDNFRWELSDGEAFQTPELVMVYSDKGLNGMSQAFHSLFRTRLARGYWRDRERPILINNWEATYFRFDEDKLLEIAAKAKELGVELFVLDDGWYGSRNNDKSSLGDWYPNLSKLPGGIKGLAEKINQLGLKFGLWFEPEMVSKDSDLFRAHPDWVLADARREYCHSRNQYVLDFSREEVVEEVYSMMSKILSEADISYVKWDMNRSLSDVFSNSGDREAQGKVRHKYILGMYSLYERLLKDFPEILFESCASGGARFDPGMLYYAPQAWASDDTDAAERLKIQYGTSMAYPVSSIGTHVSACPNHQACRTTPLTTRANVAYFGTFGYELDLNRLTAGEQEEVRSQILFMKKYRKLLQQGTFYRLKSPFEGNETAWMAVSQDRREAIVGFYRMLQPVEAPHTRVRLMGLLADALYTIEEKDIKLYGDELMYYGLSTSDSASGLHTAEGEMQGDFSSRIYHIYTNN